MIACACYMKQSSTFKNLSENRRKILKIQKENVIVWIELRLQYCRRNLRIACKAVQVAIPLGQLKLE